MEAFFNNDVILDIAGKARSLGLAEQRVALLCGLSRKFISSLQTTSVPQTQMMIDLNDLNQTSIIEGNIIPLEHWLRTASFLLSSRPQESKFFREKADEVADISHERTQLAETESTRSSGTRSSSETILEKIVVQNDLIDFSFLRKAEIVGGSVVRFKVPAFENGEPLNFPMSTQQIIGLGTGWLIGRQHLITNHHVINVRSGSDPDASPEDFALQASRAIAQFDFNHPTAKTEDYSNMKLIAADKALDYAVLKLDSPVSRPPLNIWGGDFELDSSSHLPVNIIQHPGGSPKKLGVRNNMAHSLDEMDLSYFTDTEGGSSGSPVCSDEWLVLALHKAATRSYGIVEYQGNETPWINIGTRIDRVIEDLRAKNVWGNIDATLVG